MTNCRIDMLLLLLMRMKIMMSSLMMSMMGLMIMIRNDDDDDDVYNSLIINVHVRIMLVTQSCSIIGSRIRIN